MSANVRKWQQNRLSASRVTRLTGYTHCQRVVVALHETLCPMTEIDAVIDRHGGWPGAFQMTEPLAAS
jgi:hypothetical protein